MLGPKDLSELWTVLRNARLEVLAPQLVGLQLRTLNEITAHADAVLAAGVAQAQLEQLLASMLPKSPKHKTLGGTMPLSDPPAREPHTHWHYKLPNPTTENGHSTNWMPTSFHAPPNQHKLAESGHIGLCAQHGRCSHSP